jgi:hypothetical protein
MLIKRQVRFEIYYVSRILKIGLLIIILGFNAYNIFDFKQDQHYANVIG